MYTITDRWSDNTCEHNGLCDLPEQTGIKANNSEIGFDSKNQALQPDLIC